MVASHTNQNAEKHDQRARLQAADRWTSRTGRSIEFVRRNGLSGLIAKIRVVGGATAFVKRELHYRTWSALGKRWDQKYGVDTSGEIILTHIDVVGSNKDSGTAAVSSSPSAFTFLSNFFPANWRDFTFVDIGCGKGRVLMLAALQGFDIILGIEFAPLVCQIAEQNLVRFSGRKPTKWSVVNADATAADLPLGRPLLIYCANPFKVDVWEKFLQVLLRTNEINKKPMCLVLAGTQVTTLHGVAELIDNSGRFRERAHGVTPYFMDAYEPYSFWIFDALQD